MLLRQMLQESSLTTPRDRDRVNRWKPNQGSPSLPENEVLSAIEHLNVPSYNAVDRVYVDPVLPMQSISLFSFVPSHGSTPDQDGIYGFAKIRGCFATSIEADQRAETLIRTADSYHKIFHAFVGRPFPVTTKSDFSSEEKEIDLRKKVTEEFSKDIQHQKQADQQNINQIKDQEEALRYDVAHEADPYDEYITLKVKKAQLSWTYLEHIKKINEIKDILINTRASLEKLDTDHPEFTETYYQKYVAARKQSGLDTKPDTGDSFMRFLVEDESLPGIDKNLIINAHTPTPAEETSDTVVSSKNPV
jgi:hypothetical protein